MSIQEENECLIARLTTAEAERDRQYDENVDLIAKNHALKAAAMGVEAAMLRAYHVTLDNLSAPAGEWPCNRVAALVRDLRAVRSRRSA